MRVIERFNSVSGQWEEILFRELEKDNVFRIFDNGERYVNAEDGNNVWFATSYPYYKDDILTIDTLF